MNKFIASILPHIPPVLVKPFAKRYVAGESIDNVLAVVRQFHEKGVYSTVDVLGEFIHHLDEAKATAETYKAVLESLAKEGSNQSANISIKLTALGLLLDKEACFQIVRDLVETAKRYQNFVRIDMEDSPCTTDTINLYLRLREEFSNVGIVLQAYLKRTPADAENLVSKGAAHIRLCKGIYVEPPEIAYQSKADIHKNYLSTLEYLFQNKAYVGIATHHPDLIQGALALIRKYQLTPEQYEFQMLLGVTPEQRERLWKDGHHMRVYVPFGKDWYAYSIRRLKENPTLITHVIKNIFNA